MSARIFLSRDSGFTDYVRRYKVIIDGEVKGQIKNGGTFECEIPCGHHSLQLRVDWCSSNTVEFDAEDNKTVRFDYLPPNRLCTACTRHMIGACACNFSHVSLLAFLQ